MSHNSKEQGATRSPEKGTSGQSEVRIVRDRIATALAASGMTQSELARRLAGSGATPARVESVRRLVLKWLREDRPTVPSAKYAYKLAAVFLVEPSHFTTATIADDDDEAALFVYEASRQLSPGNDDKLSGPLDFQALTKLFPHFNPMHLHIDEVSQLVAGRRAVARRTDSGARWPEDGFFQGTDMVPGFVLAETMTQTAAVALLALPENRSAVILCLGFQSMRFRRIVSASKDLTIEADIQSWNGLIAQASVTVKIEPEMKVAATGRVTLAVARTSVE